MSDVLRQIWQVGGIGDRWNPQRTSILSVVQSLDTLTTGLGWQRPSNIRAPRDIPITDDGTMIVAWGQWYDGVAPGATLPPTAVLVQTTAAPRGTWSSDLALANERAAPRVVPAYLGVQGTLWSEARTAWANHPAGTAASNAINDAERALQDWWFMRLGGATGTLAPFPAPVGTPTDTGGRTPVTPPSQGGSTSSSTSGTAVKVAGALAAAYAVSRVLRRRRR